MTFMIVYGNPRSREARAVELGREMYVDWNLLKSGSGTARRAVPVGVSFGPDGMAVRFALAGYN